MSYDLHPFLENEMSEINVRQLNKVLDIYKRGYFVFWLSLYLIHSSNVAYQKTKKFIANETYNKSGLKKEKHKKEQNLPGAILRVVTESWSKGCSKCTL